VYQAAFGYMMYIYSDPAAHVGKHEDGPSRPDIHVMIMAFLPFLEVNLVLFLNNTWPPTRLYPTAFVSILTIVHYHYVVWFSSSNYPLLSFAGPFESVLIALILVVVGLRAFTQLVTTGSIRRPLLGSGTSLMPSADEDFVMAFCRRPGERSGNHQHARDTYLFSIYWSNRARGHGAARGRRGRSPA
jgi:hypothetical protein